MQHVFETVSIWRVIKNFIVVELSRYIPFLEVKNKMLRGLLKMRVGRHVSVGLMAMLDIINPELISIGDNTIIGYNTTILSHEYLLDEFRYGPVEIGVNVLVGANCTILAGVRIGDNATVGAGTVVSKDVAPHSTVVGNPMQVLRDGGMDRQANT